MHVPDRHLLDLDPRPGGKVLMDMADGRGAFTDVRGDAFDRAVAHVADREDAG